MNESIIEKIIEVYNSEVKEINQLCDKISEIEIEIAFMKDKLEKLNNEREIRFATRKKLEQIIIEIDNKRNDKSMKKILPFCNYLD